jgi:D-alanine-D-alanine ligase
MELKARPHRVRWSRGSGSVSLGVPLGEGPKSPAPAVSAPHPKGLRGKLTHDRSRLGKVSRVIIAHNPVGPADDPSTSDVLAQVELVAGALAELGIAATRLGVADWRIWEDLQRLGAAQGRGGPGSRGTAGTAGLAPGTVVFNLVEAPPGMPGVHPATAAALELLDLPFSGSSAAALWLSTDKLATRALLAAEGVPVPAGGRLDRLGDPGDNGRDGSDEVNAGDGRGPGGAEVLDRVPPPWILKPACEDASLGLDGDAVCATRAAALARAAELLRRFPGQPLVVERYLPGRELNVSLLAAPRRDQRDPRQPPMVLPVAEIEFVDYPPGMPRIVGYEAKWQPDSFAYTHTVRRFPSEAAEAPLLAEARRLALAAWRACGLSGYGRVDLRLDERGVPHVLEVNANPCLAADAGFMAAAEQAGLSAAEVISRILADAVARHRCDRRERVDRVDRVDQVDRVDRRERPQDAPAPSLPVAGGVSF